MNFGMMECTQAFIQVKIPAPKFSLRRASGGSYAPRILILYYKSMGVNSNFRAPRKFSSQIYALG